ncbi:glycosyltransferase involved in cell wall biosynthesis [Pontibacter mucosus]|uniref:Glycosyltransferase involved in cell wall biosynthesis n=1 Tax=Pontibacter mucosus TaxID=1649266 RepID=A0A2T5YE42_9BACT|nr:glycosyltransferase [Pontibacter mucosus]PTX14988.1 glycosyltransferase involved in cell wall biosynthesis [Pontibacter mucosus]
MNILFVSRSKTGKPHPFVEEQAAALESSAGIRIQHYLVRSSGLIGYIRATYRLYKLLKRTPVDLIHAHYGLSGLTAVLNKVILGNRFKVIITYHGSDINKASERWLSLLASRLADFNILVSVKMLRYFKHKRAVIPCGINTDVALIHRSETRASNGWGENDFVILFASRFSISVKDPEFAFKVVEAFRASTTKSVKFIELKGYSRDQVTQLMQAADALLMCSKTEGSPQVVKEAIVNGLPVISNDVGDVRVICRHVDHCFILPKRVEDYVECLHSLSSTYPRIQNREPVIAEYSNQHIAEKILGIYQSVLYKPVHT